MPSFAAKRSDVLPSLRGKSIRLPNILPIFDHWPCARSPHYEKLVPRVNDRLDDVVSDRSRIPKLRVCDFSQFGALVWPFASFDDLFVMTCLTIWLFLWDDEIDESSGSLENDFNGAQLYRATTIAFVEQSTGLRDHGLVQSELHPFIGSFATIGDAIRARYDEEQKRYFFNEMVIFVEASEAEQKVKHTDYLWDLETYWHYRLGTSAVGVFSAMAESVASIPVWYHEYEC